MLEASPKKGCQFRTGNAVGGTTVHPKIHKLLRGNTTGKDLRGNDVERGKRECLEPGKAASEQDTI
jgi:hypothetical protein